MFIGGSLLKALSNRADEQAYASALANEDLSRTGTTDASYLIWRREILQVPRHAFDAYIRRLYPVQIPQERMARIGLV